MALDLTPIQHLIDKRSYVIPPTWDRMVSGDAIILAKPAVGGEIICPVSVFLGMTANATAFTYAELSALQMAQAGWQKYFDDCHAKGWV